MAIFCSFLAISCRRIISREMFKSFSLRAKNDLPLQFFGALVVIIYCVIAEKCLPTTELTSDEFCSPRAVECSAPGYVICSDGYLISIIAKYSERILLTESDTKARSSRRKEKQTLPTDAKYKEKFDCSTEWQGPPPWDPSIGGDGYPKFLCDVMVTVPNPITLNNCLVFVISFKYH